MLGLLHRSPAVRGGGRGRVVLRLEGLEARDQPSDLGGAQYSGSMGTIGGQNQRPVIVDFECREVSKGLFVITGRVVDENPGGLTVILGGSTSANGRTTTTQADGSFSLTVQLRTDGTDCGFITATTTDREGLVSEPVSRWVEPTP